MRSVELFAGCGGLALGLSQAGFEHDAVIEWDQHACRTLVANKARGVRFVQDWPVWQEDVREFNFGAMSPEPDLLSGGVPCQPFSLGGKHRGHMDTRNMFPAFIESIRQLRPRTILVENVKGLLRQTFRPYLDYVLRQISEPDVARTADETWQDHDRRLLSHKTPAGSARLSYAVKMDLLNAADYGAPQRRERVFIVGVRSDIDAVWEFPKPTHSHAALQFDQFVTGEYWQRHGMQACLRQESPSLRLVPGALPWVTVRDVISDLPAFDSADAKLAHHLLMPGAKAYAGHTGSRLDLPAKTLKAGDHGVPGGENMLVLDDGSVRYVSVREAARIQTFPDDYGFEGSWSEIMRQIGNAVPVELAFALGSKLSGILDCSGSTAEEALAIGAGAV